MTETATHSTDLLEKRRLYRRLFYGCILAGSAGLIVSMNLGHILVGVGIYWVGVLTSLAILRGTSVDLYDERDVALERRAGLITLYVIGAAAVLGFPASFALSELGYVTVTAELVGALYGYGALCGVFAVVYAWLRYRP